MEERTGISHHDLSDIEYGKRQPEKEESRKLAGALDVPIPIILYLSMELSDVQPDKVEAYKDLDKKVRDFIWNSILIKE